MEEGKGKMSRFVLIMSFFILVFGCVETDAAVVNKSPENIVILISDGCGYYHVDAASLYQYGKTGVQPYESFPVICGMITYMAGGDYDSRAAWSEFEYVKENPTDSAAAATAMSCGIKTYKRCIGVDPNKKPLKHIIERCEELSMATGVITTVPLSHATPAGFVAHNVSRNNYEEIAREMIFDSSVDVIMGCGHPLYDANGRPVETANTYKYIGGKETYDLLTSGSAGGDADGDGKVDYWQLIQSRSEFQKMAMGKTPKRVLGLAKVFQTLQQQRGGDNKADAYTEKLTETVPTLEEMTRAALNVLDNDPDGFFLMVEGGAVDWASHGNEQARVIEEQIDFNKSVEAVLEWVEEQSGWDETLVIVTSDHECGYMTGPGSGSKEDKDAWKPLENKGKSNQPGFEWHSDGHTNSLIPFYAKGFCAAEFKKCQKKKDPVRGMYINNSDIGKVIFSVLGRGD